MIKNKLVKFHSEDSYFVDVYYYYSIYLSNIVGNIHPVNIIFVCNMIK